MKMKNWMRNAGFTLVKLIVVIAVLGVLGAGAAVGYSGYTKKAAKAADEQLAAQIKYALEVAQVSDPMPNGAAALVLSKNAAATVSPTSGAAAQWVSNAMANAFGDNWKTELKLQYGEWGKGSTISASTLGYFGEVSDSNNIGDEASVKYDEGIASVVKGEAVPSFANDVDDLFVMIRDTAIAVNGVIKGESGAKLVQEAARYTTTANGVAAAEDFANMWAKEGWLDITSNAPNLAANSGGIANAGVVKARNVALACYLRSQNVDESICKKIENFSLIDEETDSVKVNVPYDAAAAYFLFNGGIANQLVGANNQYVTGDEDNGFILTKNHATMVDQLNEVLGENEGSVGQCIDSYFLGSANQPSQAYLDGLAYYTMMSTVNSVNNGAHSANDDTYWDEMAGAVGLYGSIARGEATLENLKAALGSAGADGDVSIAVMAGQKGLTVRFSPLTIAP